MCASAGWWQTPVIGSAKPDGARGRIVLIDDDPLFRESLAANLEEADFRVTSFADGPAALAELTDTSAADLVLLDWRMPEMNGIEVLRRLRRQGVEIPVMFLTVLGDQLFEEAALLGGAVDFIEKSRSFTILLKRISLILDGAKSRASGDGASGTSETIRRGRLTVNVKTKRAFWGDKPVDLTLAEFEVVRRFGERAGEDIGYRELYDQVHGEGFLAGEGDTGYRTNVRALIKRLRQKFRDVDPQFDQISNYPGFGYRWEPGNADGE